MSYAVGFIAAAITGLGWGSVYVPVKKFPTGDGLYFQWILAAGIWCTGLVIYAIQGFPKFEPIMIFGGILWCTGNALTVPVVKLVGLGLGILIWNLSSLVFSYFRRWLTYQTTGWAMTRFGFGSLIKGQDVPIPYLNYIGIGFVAASAICFIWIKPENLQVSPKSAEVPKESQDLEKGASSKSAELSSLDKQLSEKSISHATKTIHVGPKQQEEATGPPQPNTHAWEAPPITSKRFWHVHEVSHLKHKMIHFFDDASHGFHNNKNPNKQKRHCLPLMDFSKLTENQRRLLGSGLAVFVGMLYGLNVLPLQYLLDRSNGGKDHSQNGMDYVFPHFCGIYITATFYFLFYCVLRRNNPEAFPQVSGPGILSGIIWAVAQLCFFIASQNLTMVIAFPLVSTLPGAIAAIWSIFLFKEIRGRKNLLILMLSFVLRVIAVILITISKIL